MIQKKNLAILLEFGFHEVKKYLHSGFIDELSKEFNIVWFALDKGNKEFDSYFNSSGFPIVYFKESDFKQEITLIEKYNKIVRRNWMINRELGAFHNQSFVKAKSNKTAIVGNSVFKWFLENITLRNVRVNYKNEFIIREFRKNQIDLLLTTGYTSSFAKSAVISAQFLKLNIYYLVNSWKDLFIDNFLPFKNLTGIFVWSEAMESDYLEQMNFLKSEKVYVTGNPTFDALCNKEPYKSREYYSEKYNLPINSNWLLYTMMANGPINDEIETIKFTANSLLKYYSKEEFIILVRKNPTHRQEDFLSDNYPSNVRIADHYSTYDRLNDILIQSEKGEKEWVDLLIHCSINLSVPSTVSLEFIALNKKVLNIEYNSLNVVDRRLTQFFEAGYYRPLFKSAEAIRIHNSEELISVLGELKDNKIDLPPKNHKLASTTILEILKK